MFITAFVAVSILGILLSAFIIYAACVNAGRADRRDELMVQQEKCHVQKSQQQGAIQL